MNTHRIPFAIAMLALAAITPAQHNVQIGHLLVLRTGAPCSWNQILQTIESEQTRQALERACSAADLKLANARFEKSPAPNPDERHGEAGWTRELWFTIYADLGSLATAETQQTLYEQVVDDLRRRLDTQIVQTARDIQQQRLDRYEAAAGKLGARVTDLRMRIASSSAPTTATVRGNLAELERKCLDTALELRTEEATQQRMQELLAQTSKSLQVNGDERDTITRQRDRLQAEIQALAHQAGTDAAVRNKSVDLATQVAAMQQQRDRLNDEYNQAFALSTALAEDARRTTLATHRLTARMRVLEDMLVDQKRLLVEAIRAEAETTQLEAELAEALAARDEAQTRSRQCRDQLAELEPVRLQIWK